MSIVIDLLFLAIVVLTAFISAKYGFIRTLAELIGFVLIVIIINSVSLPISEAIYKSKIEKDVLNYTGSDDKSVVLPAEDFIDSLPDYLKKDNGIFAIDKKEVSDYYNKHISAGQKTIALKINNDIIKPATVKVISLLVSSVLFMILNIVVHILAKILNDVVSHSFAKGINEKLGFVIGIFKGFVICIVLCLIILLYTANTNKGIWIFSNEAINNSFLVRFTRTILPDYGVFSYIF